MLKKGLRRGKKSHHPTRRKSSTSTEKEEFSENDAGKKGKKVRKISCRGAVVLQATGVPGDSPE